MVIKLGLLLPAAAMNFLKRQHSFVCPGGMDKPDSLKPLLAEVNTNGIFTANFVGTRVGEILGEEAELFSSVNNR